MIPFRSLPTFTTVDHHYHRLLDRWLTGVEKLCALGFPARDDIAQVYNVDAGLHLETPFICYGSVKRTLGRRNGMSLVNMLISQERNAKFRMNSRSM